MSTVTLSKAECKFLAKLLKKCKTSEKKKAPKKAPKKNTKKIEDCRSKKELEKFKVDELKAWLEQKDIDTKKVAKKVKATWVKLVWENIEGCSDSSSDSSDSDSDSDSESDSSDSDSDSDSDESDSDSD
jgi:hypothetical protein